MSDHRVCSSGNKMKWISLVPKEGFVINIYRAAASRLPGLKDSLRKVCQPRAEDIVIVFPAKASAESKIRN